jgi:hypothetical protein
MQSTATGLTGAATAKPATIPLTKNISGSIKLSE